MLRKKTLRDIDVRGKKVFVRVDFNVPIEDGAVSDDTRIVGALPTIRYLIEQGATVILASHLGKPKEAGDPAFSLAPVAERLSALLGQKVHFIPSKDIIDEAVLACAEQLEAGEVLLLENTRYDKGEEKNAPELAEKFAALAEIFVDDAFGTAHRAHASNVGITRHVEDSVAGFLVEKELKFLESTLQAPERPFVAILGGAKVSDKIKVIDSLLDKVDKIIVGGGMAFTFMKALGEEIGKSLLEPDQVEFARHMIDKAAGNGVKLILPVDFATSDAFANNPPQYTSGRTIAEDMMGLDIGPRSIALFEEELKDARTVLWNGPLGAFEMDHYETGTRAIANVLAGLDAVTIIGGGDSAAAVNQFGLDDKMTHISTGGGASLQLLEGSVLPGIEALSDKE